MVRILSALVFLPIVVAAVWLLPPLALLCFAEVVLLITFVEYANLAERLGVSIPRVVSGMATLATCAAVGLPGVPLDVALMSAVIAVAAVVLGTRQPGMGAFQDVSAALLPLLYLGLPLGAIVAVGTGFSREAVLLLIFTVAISDTAQYYGGRLFGRHLLAPTISPKKTIEGAVSGFFGGIAALVGIGHWWLPGVSAGLLVGAGAVLVAIGILGDLFESMLKRSAGLKDSSGLIPGHGGFLDRIDALLFAAPVFYVFLRYGI
jgi:phosphatidate cytidylyltransferase